ncbi:MAG: HepT-like ribonuclease domain-containing protein [Opitutaceae bacterium]
MAIERFTEGLDFTRFSGDALVRAAVERQFEIIGEALGRAAREDPSLEHSMPDISRIVGLRNRLIHGYDSVDDQILWDLIQTRIPMLQRSVTDHLVAEGWARDSGMV